MALGHQYILHYYYGMYPKRNNKLQTPKQVELSQEQFDELQRQVKENNLSDKNRDLVINVLQCVVWLNKVVDAKKLSMRRLAKIFGGFKSEKSSKLQPEKNESKPKDNNKKDDPPPAPQADNKKKGNGKNGKDKFKGAKRFFHEHESLASGDSCPKCDNGKLYNIKSGSSIFITADAPLRSEIHEAEKLRCSSCAYIFTAMLPKEVREQKYDERAHAMIALMKYGTGTPFYRLAGLQRHLGHPLPSSTQWDRIYELAGDIFPVWPALQEKAAEGKLHYIDDTGGKVLDSKKLRHPDIKRTGTFTTGILSKVNDQTIKLFKTGVRHAGENIAELLKQRKSKSMPIIMSDALSRNVPKDLDSLTCFCLVHARRNFANITDKKNPQCITRHPIHLLGKIFINDAMAKNLRLDSEQRKKYHQEKSIPALRRLRRWCLKCFYLKKVEPNDEMGQAIIYLLKHWEELTQFLRVEGAPVDNNICERQLKMAILHRKNSMFYKTQLGADVGDMMMSLIATCVEAKSNPLDYLAALKKYHKLVRLSPEKWFPWNYEQNFSPA